MPHLISRIVHRLESRMSLRRTSAAIQALPIELRRDIGWPADDFRRAGPSLASLYRS